MVFGALVVGAGAAIAGEGIKDLLTPAIRSPKAPSAAEERQFQRDILAIVNRGGTPVVSKDPFTGARVLSTESQAPFLFDILGERFAREFFAAQEEARVLPSLTEVGVRFGGVSTVAPVAPVPARAVDVQREQVIQSLVATSPKVIAPGVVSSRTAKSTRPGRRLGGPCAGVTTGFQRLSCARGGFA